MSHNTEYCAKSEEKLTLGSKNDTKNLVNFNVSSGKTESLILMCYFSQQHIKFKLKNIDELSLMTLKNDANYEKKLTVCLKNDIRNFVNFNPSSGKSENLHSDGLLLQKVSNV